MKKSNWFIIVGGLLTIIFLFSLWLVSCSPEREKATEYPTTFKPTEPAILKQGTVRLAAIQNLNYSAASCFDLDKGVPSSLPQTDFCFNAFGGEDIFLAIWPVNGTRGYFLDDAPADYESCLVHLPDFTSDEIPNYTLDNIPLFPDSPNICFLTNANHLALIQAGEVKQVSNTAYEINFSYTTWDVSFTVPTATPTANPIVGDLGWGDITGTVSNGVTGTPIESAVVTCEHFSYTSPATCSGSTTTDASGNFTFEDIFFHDTDRIILNVTASGYDPQTFEQDFFTWPALYVSFSMIPIGYTTIIMCTPPLCAIGTDETYYCPGDCPGGCGTICATYTPEP